MSPETLAELLKELKSDLLVLYGSQLSGVYLFGSYAHHEQDDESDLDGMIVFKNYARYGEEIDRTCEKTCSISLKYGLSALHPFIIFRSTV